MTFEEAIRKSIRQFYDGMEPENTAKARPRRITKEHLDQLEEELLGAKTTDAPAAGPRRK